MWIGLGQRLRHAVNGVSDTRLRGVHARRKRLLTACVATFLVPLMAVELRSVDAAIFETIEGLP
jgi:hypothetical protein